MYISTNAIVSNSDMIRNYKKCREKAEGLGKVYILKFNEPDAVLFSILEYEKITKSLERIKNKEDDEIVTIKEDDEIVIIKNDVEIARQTN